MSEAARDYYAQAQQALKADMKPAAIMYFAKAVQEDPRNPDHVKAFAQSIRGMNVGASDPDLRQAVYLALESPYVDPQDFVGMWYGLLSLDPSFSPALNLAAHEDYKDFNKALRKLPRGTAIADKLFLQGLRYLILPSIVLEKFLTNLRRALLDSTIESTPLAAAIGHYCFYTGYIFEVSDEELKFLKALKARIEKAKELKKCAEDIALLACYEPLSAHERAKEIETAFAADPVLGPLVREAIAEPFEENEIAASLRRLTPVDDTTSREVQTQYTEFPYPRWRFTESNKKLSSFFDPLHDKELDILIAGCGTGQEAMYYNMAFPRARILAVDLSAASLSYAVRKGKERKVDNIEFVQADILALGTALDKKFDIIISSGVLHHMKEPEKGFSVLHGLLKPGGLMRISLYSTLGRRNIIAAHRAIAAHGYGSTADEMRRFRREAPRLLPPDALSGIMMARDYFILPQCRDLLFHVMEHQFDIPRIEALLGRYKCEFLEFVLPDEVLAQYRATHPDTSSLPHWAAFEAAHPDTFAAMYRFVCKKT